LKSAYSKVKKRTIHEIPTHQNTTIYSRHFGGLPTHSPRRHLDACAVKVSALFITSWSYSKWIIIHN